MTKYKFITFEGIEGCGKSTQSKKLQQFFSNSGIDCILTREPGGSEVGEKIRQILIEKQENQLDPKSELLLNFAARIEHINHKIKPAIEQGKIVISDRFFDSTYAYQGYGLGLDIDLIDKIKQSAIGDFAPDITFLIDIDPEQSFLRIRNRPGNNRYEDLSKDFHRKIHQGFLHLAKNNPRITIIDGSKDIDYIFSQIKAKLDF